MGGNPRDRGDRVKRILALATVLAALVAASYAGPPGIAPGAESSSTQTKNDERLRSAPAAVQHPASQGSSPADSPGPCTGDAAKDLDLLMDGLKDGALQKVDEILNCSARFAAERPTYRPALAHWLNRNREALSHLQGYQSWVRTTRLSFGAVATYRIPEAWITAAYRIETAVPSPDGQYIAARLFGSDGAARVGWWALDGRTQAVYEDAGYDLVWHPGDWDIEVRVHQQAAGAKPSPHPRGPCET